MDTEPHASENSERRPVQRADGYTPAERHLKRLCDHSFLSLWSYPNVFSAKGQELCDLLVVFGNDVLVFSDKACSFPENGELPVRWARWFRRAISQSAKQVAGAERWIRQFPERLYLDAACTTRFPLTLPQVSAARFHHVVVAHGAADACRAHFGGGNGSLMIDTALRADDHVEVTRGGRPFVVGHVAAKDRYVHVLDDFTLGIVLENLDTISDFVWYLQKKEELVRQCAIVTAAGEEEMLAWYLTHLDLKNRHGFEVPVGVNCIAFDEGLWAEYRSSAAYAHKVAADAVSYTWDRLIEKSSHHAMQGTQYWNSHGSLASSERSFRILAAEPRVRRRMLSQSIYEILAQSSDRRMAVRVVSPSNAGDPYYVLLVMPHLPGMTDDDYREGRRHALEAYCLVAKLQFPDALDIVGIATEAGQARERSEDVLYYDARSWDQDAEASARRLQKELGLLTRTNRVERKVLEYPTSTPRPPVVRAWGKVPRNSKCPCGSGVKYKRCCGR